MALKISFVLLITLCFVLGCYGQESTFTSYNDSDSVVTSVNKQLQMHTQFAELVYRKFAALLSKKVSLILWLKRFLLNVIVKMVSYVHFFIMNNGSFVADLIRIFAELVQSLLSSQLNFAVPSTSGPFSLDFSSLFSVDSAGTGSNWFYNSGPYPESANSN